MSNKLNRCIRCGNKTPHLFFGAQAFVACGFCGRQTENGTANGVVAEWNRWNPLVDDSAKANAGIRLGICLRFLQRSLECFPDGGEDWMSRKKIVDAVRSLKETIQWLRGKA